MTPSPPAGGSHQSTTQVLNLHDDRTDSSTTQVLHQHDNRTQSIHLGISHHEFGSVIAEAQRLLDDSRARADHFEGIAQTIHNQACEQIVHLKGMVESLYQSCQSKGMTISGLSNGLSALQNAQVFVAQVFVARNFSHTFWLPMAQRGPQSSPSKPDADKHHKGEKEDEVTLKDLAKMMSSMQMEMGGIRSDLTDIKGNMVTKGELEDFKKQQEQFVKDSVKAEVQQHLQELKTRNDAFQDYIHQKMIEDVKCKAKLDGFPTTWTEQDVTSDPSIAALTKKCTNVELFRNKKGEGVGKAILTYASVADRQNAVSKSRELKISGIYLNNAETELDLKKNRMLRAAFGEIKKHWEGDKKEIKIFKKEGQIRVDGAVVAERDDSTWEVVWKVPQSMIRTAVGLKEALKNMA